MALLAKQGWWLLQNPQSILAQVLKVKYYPNCSFLSASLSENASYAWRSIWEARGLLVHGIQWMMGDGSLVRIWGDPWLPAPYSFRVTTPNSFLEHSIVASDLIDESWRVWKEGVVRYLFNN